MDTIELDIASLHRATSDGSLELVYQPEIDLDSGAIVAIWFTQRRRAREVAAPAE